MNKWQLLLSELVGLGFTQYEIAEQVGCSQAYINALSQGQRGKNISFDIGSAIIEMAKKAKANELTPKKSKPAEQPDA